METTTMTFPVTRQGVRNLDAVKGPIVPVSGGPAHKNEADPINVGGAERTLSMLGGGALLAYGLTSRTTLGLGLALVGVAALFRGMTGHCDLYQMMGTDTSGRDPSAEVVYRG